MFETRFGSEFWVRTFSSVGVSDGLELQNETMWCRWQKSFNDYQIPGSRLVDHCQISIVQPKFHRLHSSGLWVKWTVWCSKSGFISDCCLTLLEIVHSSISGAKFAACMVEIAPEVIVGHKHLDWTHFHQICSDTVWLSRITLHPWYYNQIWYFKCPGNTNKAFSGEISNLHTTHIQVQNNTVFWFH